MSWLGLTGSAIILTYTEGEFAAAETVELMYEDSPPILLNDPSVTRQCGGPLWKPERVVYLQPLQLIDREEDPQPTGARWPRLLARAQAIWRRAGIQLEARPSIRWPTKEIGRNFPSAFDLKKNDTAAAFNEYSSTSPENCVDVYLVDSRLTDGGEGGAANLPPYYLAGAKIVSL